MKGPLFHYTGPYHFKVPFSIAGSKGSGGGGARTGGSTRSAAPGGGGAVTAPQPAPASQPTGLIWVAPAAERHSSHPAGLWLLIPAGLLAIAAVAAVVFEPKQRRDPAAS